MNFDTDTPATYAGDVRDSMKRIDDTAIFSTYDRDYGIVPEPRPAREFRPTWYDEDLLDDSTVDALNEGWILRTPARVEINTTDESSMEPTYRWNFHREALSLHGLNQTGDMPLHVQVTKFHSYWMMALPDGYSALLLEPLGRGSPLFTPFSGVIDFDNFSTFTHAPSRLEGRFHEIIDEGQLIFQVIPFKRDDMIDTATIRTATEEEIEGMESGKPPRDPDRDPTTTDVDVESIV